MRAEPKAPTTVQVVQAIAQREIRIAMRRRLTKLLFLGSLLPPLVMAVLLVVRVMLDNAGLQLGWDPLARFIEIQVGPVLFLALAIGAPSVARDRQEEVLFLYATRPVTPWSYTLGKMAAVAVPAVALLVVPGIVISILRLGLLEEFGALDSLVLLGKLLVVAALAAAGYAGLTIGASAATKKARWALLAVFACVAIPATMNQVFWFGSEPVLDAPSAVRVLVDRLFDSRWDPLGTISVFVLIGWGAAGALVTSTRVRGEMTP